MHNKGEKIPSRDALREKGLVLEDLIEAYEQEKTIVKAARKVGVSSSTFHRIMLQKGYVFTRGRKNTKKKHTSVVANWLRKHSDVALPRNYKKISEIMDIPLATVRAYFKRRQDRMQQILIDYHDIIGLPLFGLKDVSGNMITNKGLNDVKVYVDDFALCYVIKASTLSGARLTFIRQFEEYLEMFEPKEKE